MKLFKLPDLGEGLPDAIIREWYVKEGDTVTLDQPLVAMETAKALVDVPSPYDGEIEKLFGAVGDTIETGQPLIGFVGEGEVEETTEDSGTVVGAIEKSNEILSEEASGVSKKKKTTTSRVKATPAVRALAKKLGVDLNDIQPTGPRITRQEVEAAAQSTVTETLAEGFEKLNPARQAMVMSMRHSHSEIVPATLVDDADIQGWNEKEDVTLRLIRAIQSACEAVPILNAHFNSKQMAYRQFESINLGIAVDTPHGLYVPVLKDIAKQNDSKLRDKINQFKEQAKTKSISQENLHGATIMLSNFGTFAGRYASPVITPPMVAIIGVGRSRKEVVVINETFKAHKIMPLSVTFDHRLVTGGEAARFLKALIDSLSENG